MADSKKYNGSQWEHSLRKLGTATDTIATLPADLYADGTNATVDLVGNMQQTGTPTPQNPVDVNGTGERTGNLFDISTVENGKGIATDGSIINYEKRCSTVTPIDVSTYNNVTLAFTAALSRTRVIYALFNDSTLVTRQTAVYSGTMIDVSSGNKLYICFYDAGDTETVQKSDLSNVMLNEGSTALPYEPYGYKIPISSANTTTPVYLGEVESTRLIRELVLTGEETWYSSSRFAGSMYAYNSQFPGIKGAQAVYCSHLPYTPAPSYQYGTITTTDSDVDLWMFTETHSPAAFKSYLAQQYAAGTPVTVWYVLATEETGIVNEPLRKIGDYADSISGISIPTTDGANTVSVDTTVQPSEMTMTYHGWHTGAVHERESGSWD